MYTDFSVKNFRVFDNNGTLVPLRPITILTGCNNTGKSSIVKALCLLKDFCGQLETDFEDGKKLHLDAYKMDFHKSPNNVMGSFDLVRHFKRTDNKELDDTLEKRNGADNVILEIVVESSWLLQDVILHLEFNSLDWDDLNNGYLQAYSIRTLDGNEIYKANRNEKASMDFSHVKKELLHFLYGQHAFAEWQNEVTYRMATCSEPAEEDKEGHAFDGIVKNVIDNLGPTALVYLFEWQASHCHHPWKDGYNSSAESIIKKSPDISFTLNSPSLGVYFYFPFLYIVKDVKKSDIRAEICKKIETGGKTLSEINRKIIQLFLDSYEESEANSIDEFISQKENERFFVDKNVSGIGKTAFTFPNVFWRKELNSVFYDDSQLPEKATWPIILLALDSINQLMTDTTSSYLNYDEINNTEDYFLENKIDQYLRSVIEDVFVHALPGSFSYTPTTIVQPRRMYSLEENSDFSRTLKEYFDAKRLFTEDKDTGVYSFSKSQTEEKDYIPCTFINNWLNLLGIAHRVEIKSHADGYGVTIHLYEDANDDKGMLLTDKGFGVLQLFAVLLKIETSILEMKTNEELYKYNTTGLNKDIVKYLRTHNQLHPTTIALEEPECHLHPSLQSKFADIIIDANKQYGIHFIIESHSEYFIRKLQLLVAQKELANSDISLLYVNPTSKPPHIPVITDIGMDEEGLLKNEFGSGFFDESLRLSRDLFKSKTEDDEE